MPRLRAEAGSRPGGRGTFLCFAKEKYPKERRPPVCDPFAVRRGKPASCRLRGAPWNSLCAARAAQTATASQFTKHGRFDAHAHPATAPPQAQPAGVGSQTSKQPDIHSGHRCARLGLRSAWRLRPRVGAERSAAKQRPVWMFGSPCPSGCAEERRVWRIRARDCLSEASSSETPPNPSTAGCPVAKRRGRRQWGRPFFGSFLSATRKKGTRMPGDSRPPPSPKAHSPIHPQAPATSAKYSWGQKECCQKRSCQGMTH